MNDDEYIDPGEVDKHVPQTPEEILGDACPIEALGHSMGDGHNMFHFLDVKGQVQSFTARTLTSAAILGLFFGDLTWLQRIAPNRTENEKELPGDRAQWKATRITPLLMRACYVAGFFDPDAVRGPGVWPFGKVEEWPRADTSIVVHMGDSVLILEEHDGAYTWPELATRAGVKIGEFVYCRAAPEEPPANEPLDAADAKRIRNFLGVWNWEDDTQVEGEHLSRFLLFGHIGAGVIPGLLPRRPSSFLTGPSGSGKSRVLELQKGLNGSGAIKLENTSQTGIRKRFIGINPARMVLCNEVESRGGREVERLQEVYDLARYCYSAGEGAYGRGGEGLSGQIVAIFGFAAIRPPRLEQQDANRMLLLRMGKLRVDAKQVRDFDLMFPEIVALGPYMRRRMIDRWPAYPKTFAMFREALIGSGHEPRPADTFGTLLACAWLLSFDGTPEEADYHQWAANTGASLLASAMEESAPQWQRCLNDLMTARVEEARDKTRVPLGDIIELVFRDPNVHEAHRTLKSFGLARVIRVGHGEKKAAAALGRTPKQEIWLAVAYEHQGLDEIFRPTEWKNGSWCSVLPQMPGAERNHPANFGGAKRSKAILIPMEMVITRPEEDALHADDPNSVPKYNTNPFDLKEPAR